MHKTIRILTLVAAMIIGAGETWAEDGVKYIDESGVEQTANNVTVLTGSTELATLGADGTEKWYVVKNSNTDGVDAVFSGGIELAGVVHLILADGAEMTVAQDATSRRAITGAHALTIYGQSGGTGCLEVSGEISIADGTYPDFVNLADLTICGGFVSTTGNICGGNVTICGGKVSAESVSGINAYGTGNISISGGEVRAYNIYAGNGNVNISGGKVSATNAISALGNGGITLGLTEPTDYIYANTYFSQSSTNASLSKDLLMINADGTMNSYISGSVAFDDPDPDGTNTKGINGKTLRAANYCGEFNADENYRYKGLVWYLTEGNDGVKTLHIEKNPNTPTGGMADYNNDDASVERNFAPWIKPNNEGKGSDGLRYGITAVAIGAGVTSIGKKAFDGCKSLTSVTFAEVSQLKSIGGQAFQGCKGLTTMTLPSSLTTIGEDAFSRCGFTTVTIPASVTSIGSRVFSSCINLKTVIFERYDISDSNPITDIVSNSFRNINNLKVILVPSEAAYAAYKAAGSGWNQDVNNRPLKSYLAPATISVAKNEGGWSTFCHNYGVAYSPSEGVTVHTVNGLSADGKSVNTKQVDGNLVIPGTPLLLNYSGTGYLTLTAEPTTAQTISSTDALVSTSGDGWAFIGNAGSDLASDADALKDIIHIVHNDNDKSGIASYVLSGSDFVIVRSNSGLKAHRCLLNVSSGTASSARRLSIARGGETTGTSTPEPTYGNIFYYDNVFYNNKPNAYGGWLQFYKDADCQNSLSINTVSGLTDGIVYIKATPDNLHTLKGFLPEVEKCSESGSAQSRTRSLRVNVGVPIEVTAVDGKTGVYQFTMPADGSDVVVSMAFPDKDYETKVKYLKWNDTDKKLEETTTDDNTKVYILDGTETELEGGWYIAKSDIDLSKYGGIELKGDVHLILADKAAMTCSGIKDDGTVSLDLTIHGQSTGDDMGKLTVTNTSGCGIDVHYLTINGGIVEATANDNLSSINVNALTIYGGRVRATNTTSSSYCILSTSFRIFGGHVETSENSQYGIYADWNVEIYGGQVEAAGTSAGILYINKCTLDWTDPDNDYIKVTGIRNGNGTDDVSVAKRFVAYNPVGEGETELAASGIIGGKISDLSAFDRKTLRPLDGYVVKDLAGVTFSGKTDTDGKPKPDFTITTTEGVRSFTTPYYIYKKDATVTVASTCHDEDYIEMTGLPDGVQTSEQALAHSFTMPAQDVTITSVKYYTTGVKYIDPTADEPNKTTADGTRVYVLDGGGATTLPGGWYVVKDNKEGVDASYDVSLLISGDTHLILADGAEMMVNNTIYDCGIYVNYASFTIYGQGGETEGKLTTINPSGAGIEAIWNTPASLTINGGQVIATATSDTDYGIRAIGTNSVSNSIIINGGQVTATGGGGGIYADTNDAITLGLNHASDYIMASSYEIGGVGSNSYIKIADSKALAYTDDKGTTILDFEANPIYEPGYSNATLEAIAGKKLVPAMPIPKVDSETYVAYCSDKGNWKLSGDDAQVYVITGYDLEKGVVYLTPVTGNEIPDGVAVIIGKSDGSALPNDLWLVGEQNLSPDAENDCLKAVANFVFGDKQTTLQELIDGITGSTDTPVSDYVVFILDDGKFKPIIANASSKPGLGECLLIIPKVELLKQVIVGGGSSARKLIIDLGNATGIEENAQCTMHNAQSDGEWYDLQGRKLDGQPTTKGVFIHNGNKIVITK